MIFWLRDVIVNRTHLGRRAVPWPANDMRDHGPCGNDGAGYLRAARGPVARAATSFALIVLATSSAIAHAGSTGGDFIGGFAHPLFGPDQTVAMVAVGLWGAFLG